LKISFVSRAGILVGILSLLATAGIIILLGRRAVPASTQKSPISSADLQLIADTPFAKTDGTDDPVIAAVGDMVPGTATHCSPSSCKQMQVSQLILDMHPMYFFALGDTQYENGEYSDFLSYYSPSFGRLKAITKPAIGNHEYDDPAAKSDPTKAGYWDYFNGLGNFSGVAGDRDKGYYAFDVGTWRVYVLNTNCSQVGGCKAGSPQEQWLRADLAANPRECQLMYYHHPYISNDTREFSYYKEQYALWQDFYQYGGDVVLTGHSHFYARYAPMNPDQEADPTYGIREIIVGTGGSDIYAPGAAQPLTEVQNGTTFGALKMVLHPDSYDWQFVPIPGFKFTDRGSYPCHSAPLAGYYAAATENSSTTPP